MVEWGQISLTTPEGDPVATLQVRPENINMSKVSATLRIIDAAVHDAEPKSRAIADDLERAAELPATPTPWFVFACAAGACGLGAIFGAHTPAAYVLIALAAALGGLLRRALGRHGVAATAQAICAALVAGVVGGIGAHLGISSAARLVAVCPAMVLVPGPHLINGMIDVAERHLQVGLARIAYGATTLIGIGIGLVLGLATKGTDLPITAPGVQVALPIDILGAALAAASYPLYFSMPRRDIVWPVLVGSGVHAVRWVLIYHAGSQAIAADFITCMLAGIFLGTVARTRHLPFAGIGFAAVVALVPGMYVFRACAGAFVLADEPTDSAVRYLMSDIATSVLILTAIAAGLVLARSLENLASSKMRRVRTAG